ncbi:MAG: hypothetical protein IKE52_07280 [Mogibacterium sp.]|nr:hypothetical protein [Mogibacterium sp.]
MNSKDKGRRGERELAKELRQNGYDTRRGQQYSGANGDADVVGLSGIHIECKRRERLNIYDAIQQAVSDTNHSDLPAVFWKKNRKPWLVCMRLDDWLSLYDKYIFDNDTQGE